MPHNPHHSFDFIVVGATPGGIACAIRAAREGLKVLLTNHYGHVGGMLSNGLGCLDTQYSGNRAPIHAEFCDRLLNHYQRTYGHDSANYRACFSKVFRDDKSTPSEMPRRYRGRLTLESHVAEAVFKYMLETEPNITLWLSCTPHEVRRQNTNIQNITFLFKEDGSKKTVHAHTYADCTYEGDLLALAGAQYHVGRESREAYNEAHAGRIFMAMHVADGDEGYPRDAVEGRLNVHPYEVVSQEVFAGSTGEGDNKVQAYTFRLTLTDVPENRIQITKPASYNRDIYVRMRNRWGLGGKIPNGKLHWNTSNLPGGNWTYPEAAWEERDQITLRHLDHALGFLWFLQNDEAVPEALRNQAKNYGLARDEYTDNKHVPWEMYVREARRLLGRYVFTENDGTFGPGLNRAPIQYDSIAITEWGMDSHSVSEEMAPGSRREGKILLTELTRPGQVPYRCLLPREIDNLLVPVCLSASHVGWGTIRLEPTWMHIGESAGHAAALATKISTPVADLNTSELQRILVQSGVMISFFNEFDMDSEEPWASAIQYLGTRNFFASYDAVLDLPLDYDTAKIWSYLVIDELCNTSKMKSKERWSKAYPESLQAQPIISQEFREMLSELFSSNAPQIQTLEAFWPRDKSPENGWSRGEACRFFYTLLTSEHVL